MPAEPPSREFTVDPSQPSQTDPESENPFAPALVERVVAVNDLFVRLLRAPMMKRLAAARYFPDGRKRPRHEFKRLRENIYPRITDLPGQWLHVDLARVRWLDGTRVIAQQRILEPDAVLELAAQGRRYFIEYHADSSRLLGKLEDYESFFSRNIALGRNRKYADGLVPAVRFLAPTTQLVEQLNAAVSEWQHTHNRTPFHAAAVTIDQLFAEVQAFIAETPSLYDLRS